MLDIEWNEDGICYQCGHYILSNLIHFLVLVLLVCLLSFIKVFHGSSLTCQLFTENAE